MICSGKDKIETPGQMLAQLENTTISSTQLTLEMDNLGAKQYFQIRHKTDLFIDAGNNDGKIIPPHLIRSDAGSAESSGVKIQPQQSVSLFQQRSIKLDFPMFDGNDPSSWFACAERYMGLYSIHEEQRVNVAAFYLEGEAFRWFEWMQHKVSGIPWMISCIGESLTEGDQLNEAIDGNDSPVGNLDQVLTSTSLPPFTEAGVVDMQSEARLDHRIVRRRDPP
ncbi:hypothetical protein HHK36_005694 [Tetracentron sinense]|uniref:Retrotransposon gag domain-containing protein n=1 Tax=Tetracentron sinense TaxID=13715 RepID=A0A834ZLW2_TETSI|nr:hypothetical protein HHK36_005694 [Tetracentron sinense]